ncbi:hypothetical protein [Marinobacter mobilis]|uniref:hypothetical protein n=1 Tax=Marinobacter mobilis TaxID=488533 RepID=UPI0035C78623
MTLLMQPSDSINLDSYATPNLELERQGWGVPDPADWIVDSKFRQTDGRRRISTLYKRFNRHYLAIRRQHRQRSLPEQVIDLSFIEREPREIRDDRLWLWALAVMCLLAPSLVYYLTPYLPLWGAPPVALGLLMMAMAWRGRTHDYQYLALHTDTVVFTVDGRLPEQSKVTAFIEELGAAIDTAQKSLPEGRARIPLAVTEMRRLCQAGIIADDDYEAAKGRWFSPSALD